MGIGNYSKGWGSDGIDDYGGDDGGSGGSSKLSDRERLFKYRFNIPSPDGTAKIPNLVNKGKPATKRVLILDGEPFCLHEHNLYNFKNAWRDLGSFTAICLQKNGLYDKGCPLCAKNGGDEYPAFTGFFPVIDMGQVEYVGGGNIKLHHEYWLNNKGEKNFREFPKLLLGAKRGSQDKPGVLKTLQFQMEKRGGDLTGTVWDVTRTGSKAAKVGDSWDFVEKIKSEDFLDYLVGFGADRDELDLTIPIMSDMHSLKQAIDTKDTSQLVGVFDIVPELYYKQLAHIVGWGSGDSKQYRDAEVSGSDWNAEDDIPF